MPWRWTEQETRVKAFSVKTDQDISLALFLWARSLQTYKKYLFVLSVCVKGTYAPQHVCRGQRTIWCGQPSPSTMRVSHSKPSCQASRPNQQDFNQRMQLQVVLGSGCSGYLPEIYTNQLGLVVHACNLSTSWVQGGPGVQVSHITQWVQGLP